MNDFSKPDDTGGERPAFQGRHELTIIANPPNPDPVPCPNGRYVVTASITQKIAACANAEYLGLYQIAVSQIDARLANIRCAEGCRRTVIEIFRSRNCVPSLDPNPSAKATVVVSKALYCGDELPPPERQLRPAQADTFTSPGSEPAGVAEPTWNDSSIEEIGKPAELSCSETRTFYLKYSAPEPACPNVTDYKKYVDAANERVRALSAAMVCKAPCAMRTPNIEWQSWKCETGKVVVEIYFKLECLPVPGAGARPGCLGMLLGMK